MIFIISTFIIAWKKTAEKAGIVIHKSGL